jgi:hypothetical protein
MTKQTTCLLLALAGCSMESKRYAANDWDAAAVDAVPIDAIPPDAMPCVADTIECIDDVGLYVECGSDGRPAREIECPLGCASGQETCLDVAPSNSLGGYLDQARIDENVVDVVFTGASTIDTGTGAATIAGVTVSIPNGTSNGVRVFMFKDVEIAGTLKVTGTMGLALVADGRVEITGLVDVSADQEANGPGAATAGACLGDDNPNVTQWSGGGGGGHFENGAGGGGYYGGAAGGSGGEATSTPTLDPLMGGCRGGASQGFVSPEPPPQGGGGGGAIQIVSRREIALLGGGTIDASGGGGGGADAVNDAGHGGGSGGSVLLEAPVIDLDGVGVAISTKGGGGTSANGAAEGADGGTHDDPAEGGYAAGWASGGAGGTASAPPGVGGNGNSTHPNGGGGGGSVGEARFNDSAAAISPMNGAAIRSRYTAGEIASRLMQL